MKTREEMPEKYRWDLGAVFETPEAWEAAYKEAEGSVEAFSQIRADDGEKETVLKVLQSAYETAEKTEKVYLYASLCKASDSGNAEFQRMEGQAMMLYVKLSAAASFIEPYLLSLPQAQLEEYMKDAAFAPYRHYAEDVCRARNHTLSSECERLLASLSDAARAPEEAFNMLNNAELEFPPIETRSGEKLILTNASYAVYIRDKDRDIRRQAFENLLGQYKKYINTIAELYGGAVKLDCFYSDARGHEDACSAALFAGKIPVGIYDRLTEAVRGGIPVLERYSKLCAKVLGIENIDMYDLYVPITDEVESEMEYHDAQQLVKKALAPLGEEYGRLLDKAYSERWIDVYEGKGKTTGAFSCGVYGAHPYVLLNYNDTLDDAFTLAHELGHAMHSYFSDSAQDFVNHDYHIIAAEVASTVNEVLLTMYLLKTETQPKRRAYILNHFLESFRLTVFRQTLFAEFERKAHEMYQSGTALTAQALTELYGCLAGEYYAGVAVPELYKYEWARIPHFYNSFYVYQYATGFCSAVAIASRILETGDAGSYLHFLSLGGSAYPLDELRAAGADLENPATVADALKVFESTLDELEALL